MSDDPNPRAGIGANFPPLGQSIAAAEGDFAAVTTAYLDDEHGKQRAIVDALLGEARDLPSPIENDSDKERTAGVIKRLRDQAKLLTGLHGKEKQPYLRGGQAVDQWFFGLIDKVARRDRKARPGAADVLNARLTDYDNRKLAEEQARRAREAAEQARIAREAREKAEREAREAEEARLAAERARAPAKVAAKAEVAREAEAKADAAKVEAEVTTARAEEAHVATLARPADIMRTRGSDGTLSTMGQEKYAEITDRDALNKEILWPYLKLEALESALTQWARFTDYNVQMPGAAVGRRNKSVVR